MTGTYMQDCRRHSGNKANGAPPCWTGPPPRPCPLATRQIKQYNNDSLYSIILLPIRNLGSAWIGLDDKKMEGTFKWIGGKQRVKYTNWGVGEPNNGEETADCVEMITGVKYEKQYDGAWNDEPCVKNFNFICEIPRKSVGKL